MQGVSCGFNVDHVTRMQNCSRFASGEIIREKKMLKCLMSSPGIEMKQTISTVGGKQFNASSKFDDGSDSEDETFHDADKKQPTEQQSQTTKQAAGGWAHRTNIKAEKEFDPWGRNPSYSGADNTTTWSMASYLNHFHPAVRNISEGLIKSDTKVISHHYLTEFSNFLFRNIRVIRSLISL